MSEIVKLDVPIEAHGEQLTELTLRRPTVLEVRKIKVLPYKVDQNEDAVLDMEAVGKYIAVCAAIPPTSVNDLDLADLNKLGWKLFGFFMNAASKPSPT